MYTKGSTCANADVDVLSVCTVADDAKGSSRADADMAPNADVDAVVHRVKSCEMWSGYRGRQLEARILT